MNSCSPIRVVLVDEHAISREALASLLEQAGEFVVVGQASDGTAAVQAVSELRPDVVLLDVIIPQQNGIEVCREIMEHLPEARVLILTATYEEDAVIDAIAAGATGYVQMVYGSQRLRRALREVAAGEYQFPRDALRRVFAGVRSTWKHGDAGVLNQLSERDRELLTLFAEGKSYVEIAELRSLSRFTVRNAINAIQQKLDIDSKQELVVWAVRQGLLDEFPAVE